MKYAIVRISGHQYKVTEGQDIYVDKTKEPSCDVLLYVDGEKVVIGTPTVKGAKVSIKAEEDLRGEKINVFKYKAKSRYRKKIGFRPEYSHLRIEKISL